MRFQNRKKDGFSIIEVMVSFVIILVIVLLIVPNLFSTYERSKQMSKISDENAIVNAIDMHNLNLFVDGKTDAVPETMSMGEFKKINDERKYLNNWPNWIEDSMTIKNIRDIANRVEVSKNISKDLVFIS